MHNFHAIALAAALALPAVAQTVSIFSGELTAAETMEVKAWGVAFWQRAENGAAAAPVMTFSTAAMNSALFNPRFATRATLENLQLIAHEDCDSFLAAAPPTDQEAWKKRAALKEAMTELKFRTDPVENQGGTVAHVNKILDATYTASLVTYTEDGKLVSEALPLDVLVGSGASAVAAQGLTAETATYINAIVVQAPAIAATATGLTEAQKSLVGGVSKSDDVGNRIAQLLHTLGSTRAHSEGVLAAFAVYGALPVLAVHLPGAFVLVDTTNGNVIGPFDPGSEIDTRPLLAAHPEYQAGTSVRNYRMASGCERNKPADALAWCLKNDPVLKKMTTPPPAGTLPAGCTLPDVVFTTCPPGTTVPAWYNGGRIYICENIIWPGFPAGGPWLPFPICIAVAHEYQHAIDRCNAHGTGGDGGSATCLEVACAEVRAAEASGQCCWGSDFRLTTETYEQCIRRMARASSNWNGIPTVHSPAFRCTDDEVNGAIDWAMRNCYTAPGGSACGGFRGPRGN